MSTGWQCPVCYRVHAPWVAHCDCDARQRTFLSGGTDWPPSHVCEGDTSGRCRTCGRVLWRIGWEHLTTTTPFFDNT